MKNIRIAILLSLVLYIANTEVSFSKEIEIRNIGDAVLTDDVKILKAAIARWPESINRGYDDTPLLRAVKRNNKEITEILLKHGAEVKKGTTVGPPLLHVAIRNNKAMVELLLKHGADVNKKYKTNDKTPLYLAIEKSSSDIVHTLLKYKTNPNGQCYGKSYLYHAFEKNNKECAEHLINYGANITSNISPDDYHIEKSWKAIHYASAKDYINVIKTIGKRMNNIDIKDNDGSFPLHLAMKNRSKSCIEYLIKNTKNINEKNKNGDPPLYLSVTNHNKYSAELLIKKGANLNIKYGEDKNSLLHILSKKSNIDIATILINNPKVDVNIEDKKGNTPLHIATENYNINLISALLKNPNINPNKVNVKGDTPLHTVLNTYENINKNEIDCLSFLSEYIMTKSVANQQKKEIKEQMHKAVDKIVASILSDPKIHVSCTNNTNMTPSTLCM